MNWELGKARKNSKGLEWNWSYLHKLTILGNYTHARTHTFLNFALSKELEAKTPTITITAQIIPH